MNISKLSLASKTNCLPNTAGTATAVNPYSNSKPPTQKKEIPNHHVALFDYETAVDSLPFSKVRFLDSYLHIVSILANIYMYYICVLILIPVSRSLLLVTSYFFRVMSSRSWSSPLLSGTSHGNSKTTLRDLSQQPTSPNLALLAPTRM